MRPTRRERILVLTCGAALSPGLAGCAEKFLDVAGPAAEGSACDFAGGEKSGCDEGLSCEPVAGATNTGVCAEPLQIRGMVIDLQTGAPVAGALVNGLDATGAPLGEVAVSDAEGRYTLQVGASRLPDGALAPDLSYTLQAFARDYAPFPGGIRVALPLDASTAVYEETSRTYVIESPLTTVGLVMSPPELRGGVTLTGSVGGADPGGTLVVAEGVSGDAVAQYGVADRSGAYTVFNVQAGVATIRGYRRGLELVPVTFAVGTEDLEAVNLAVAAEGDARLGSVSGSVQIVNAIGGTATSVVLVPVSVFGPALERGPVPFGLRAPESGRDPDVDNMFTIEGVPAGRYKVLAAFENDGLVRDPDPSIGGTNLQEVTLAAGEAVAVQAGFKITAAIEVVAPGAEEPTEVGTAPSFEFVDDASEKGYLVRVFDVFGEIVWENAMIPGVQGATTVKVTYGGPALTPGLYYQFRVLSLDGSGLPLAATEDLRGVFLVR